MKEGLTVEVRAFGACRSTELYLPTDEWCGVRRRVFETFISLFGQPA